KKISIFLALITALILGGCSNDNETSEGESEAGATSDSLNIAVGGSGGGWYIAGSALSAEWENDMEGLTTTLVPGGGLANPTRVNQHDEDIGFTYNTNAVAAVEGTGDYDEPHTKLKALVNLNVKQFLHLMVSTDEDVELIDDVLDDNFTLQLSPGPRGAGAESATQKLLSEMDMSYDDLDRVEFGSPNDAIDQIKDGHLNAVFAMADLGLATFADLALSREIKTIGLSDELLE